MADRFVACAAIDLAHARDALAHLLATGGADATGGTSQTEKVADLRAQIAAIRAHIDYYTETLGFPAFEEPAVQGLAESISIGDACERILRVYSEMTTRAITTMLVEVGRVRSKRAYNTVARALAREARFHKVSRATWALTASAVD